MMSRIFLHFIIMLALPVYADVASTFGAGSHSASLAGSSRNFSRDFFAPLYNPALMSWQGAGGWSFSYLGANTNFKEIRQVVVDNDFTGGTLTYGNASVSTTPTQLMALGGTWALGKKWHWGASFILPLQHLMSVQSKDAYLPQYSQYENDTQKFQIALAGSWLFDSDWSLGWAAQVFYTSGVSVQTRLPTDGTPQRSSTMSTRLEAKPAVAPAVSLMWRPTENQRTQIGYLGERDARVKFDTYIGVNVLGPSPVPIQAVGNFSANYDPETWSASYAYNFSGDWLHLTADYYRWSLFDGQVVHLDFQNSASFHQYFPSYKFRDVLVPRIGFSKCLHAEQYVQFGYAFVPTPVPDNSGDVNFVDSDRHVFSLGYEKSFHFEITNVLISTHLQYHSLVSRHVTKINSTSLGAPGYDIGGSLVSYGFTTSFNY